MNKLLLIFLLSCATFMAPAQINKMYRKTDKATTIATMQPAQNNNANTMTQNSVSNNPAASYRGMINISASINSKMQTEWNTSSNYFGGNQLKAELWSVVYRPDPNKQNYTQILLQQHISNVNSSYQSVAGGLSFSISNLPADKNLVVVVYCNPLKSAPGLVIKGKPDDGSSIVHHFESDVKSKLGQNVVYGICSIIPGKTDLSHLDFDFFSAIDDVIGDVSNGANHQPINNTDSSHNAGNIKQPEYRQMQNLRIINVAPVQSTAAIDLIYYNPNNFAMQVDSANGNIYIDSSVLGQFQLSKMVQVEKNSEFTLPTLIKVNTMDVLRNQGILFKKDEEVLKVKGTAIVNIGGVLKKVLIEYGSIQNVAKLKMIVSN